MLDDFTCAITEWVTETSSTPLQYNWALLRWNHNHMNVLHECFQEWGNSKLQIANYKYQQHHPAYIL